MKLKVRRGERILGEFDMQSLVVALSNGDVSAYDEIFYPQEKRWIRLEEVSDIRDNVNANFDWKLKAAGVEMGPMTKREVLSRIRRGQLNEDDLAYHPKTGEWVIVGEVREFAFALQQAGRVSPKPGVKREPASDLVKVCEKCGTQNLKKNLVCMNCGARFPKEGVEGVQEAETPPLERIKTGAIAGAIGGVGCSMPILMLTFLGLSFVSIFLPIGGARAAGVLAIRLFTFVLAGALAGAAIGYIGAFEFGRGSGIGAMVGAFLGLLFAIAAGAGYVRSTIEWAFDCMIMGLLIVYVGRQFFYAHRMVVPDKLKPKEESARNRIISIVVGVVVGLLITVFMIRGQTASNRPSVRRARAFKAIKVEVTDGYFGTLEEAVRQVFVVEGKLTNVSRRPKFMIGLEGYLIDADGDTIAREYDTFTRKKLEPGELLRGNLSQMGAEMARAGALRPRETVDFKMEFHMFGEVPDVSKYDVVVTSVLDYKGKF